jgi:anti-sigma factor RsiW
MDCKDIKPMLSAYYDKELSADEREKVAAHMKSCVSCQKEYSDICRTWEALKTAEDVPVPAGFRSRVTARVNAFQMKRSKRFIWQAAAIAAVFLIAFGLVFMMTRPADNPVAQNLPAPTAPVVVNPNNGTADAELTAEDADVLENLDVLENYEILDEMDELIDMAALDEITDDELEGVE